MDIELTLKNYRCFPESKPVRIVLRKGFTSFVGVNNSGKSSLLKFFFEFRELFRLWSLPSGHLISALSGSPVGFSFARSIFDPQHDVFFNSNSGNLVIDVRLLFAPGDVYSNPQLIPNAIVLTILRKTNTFRAEAIMSDGPLIVPSGQGSLSGTLLSFGGRFRADLQAFFDAFSSLVDTLYIGAFRNALNVGTKEDYFDIQVGQSFIQQWASYKTGAIKKQNDAAYKVQTDIQRIFGFEDLEINAAPNNLALQVRINGLSYNLMELGSGLTQFILVLANASINQRKYILIDEPELNLHPSLQLDFLTTLGSYATEGVLFATHSVGLARAIGDWRYSVRWASDKTSEVAELDSTPRLSEFLSDLGFSGYRELGFGKILLVEGKTDVKTMQQLLRLCGHTMINASSEDELAEITRIADEIYAVIDSERTAADAPLERGREEFRSTCKKLKIKCHILERRAIENYFSPGAVLKVRGEKWQALEPYQKVGDAWPGWSKNQNWRVAREVTRDELAGTDLGVFLEAL
jgi:predicted ATPase